MRSFISPDNFDSFTYSKQSHFLIFKSEHCDKELYNRDIDPKKCAMKCWADMMVFAFIRQNIPAGSKILEVGGGNSRILRYFSQKKYECWNIDRLEGLGQGPKNLDEVDYRVVLDYIGNFNRDLPNNYFDLVFSISALEHTPTAAPSLFGDIFEDIQRVLKPGGYSLHCFDIVVKNNNNVGANPLLRYLFEHTKTCNAFIPFKIMQSDPDLYTLSEEIYNRDWERHIKKPYSDFGRPTSYNILWRKDK